MSKANVIKLTQGQFDCYNKNELKIQAPDGTLILKMSALEEKDRLINGIGRMYKQLALTTCLLNSVNKPIKLSKPASVALHELLHQLEGHIEETKKLIG